MSARSANLSPYKVQGNVARKERENMGWRLEHDLRDGRLVVMMSETPKQSSKTGVLRAS